MKTTVIVKNLRFYWFCQLLLTFYLKFQQDNCTTYFNIFKIDNNKAIRNNGRANKMFKNLSKFKNLENIKFEILTYTNIKAMKKLIFLTLNNKTVLNLLRQIVIEALILQNIDLK